MGWDSVGQRGPELVKVPFHSPRDPSPDKETKHLTHRGKYAGPGAWAKVQEQRGSGKQPVRLRLTEEPHHSAPPLSRVHQPLSRVPTLKSILHQVYTARCIAPIFSNSWYPVIWSIAQHSESSLLPVPAWFSYPLPSGPAPLGNLLHSLNCL